MTDKRSDLQFGNLKRKILKNKGLFGMSRWKNGNRPRRTLHPWTEALLLEKPVTG